VASLFGVIHSPLQPAAIALPSTVLAQMPQDPAIRCQSPYHWAAAYALAAILLLVLSLWCDPTSPSHEHGDSQIIPSST
jgi:hypothetical protein